MKLNLIGLFAGVVGFVVLMTGSSAHAATGCYVPETASGFPQQQYSAGGYPSNYELAPGFVAGSTGGEVVCFPQYTATVCEPNVIKAFEGFSPDKGFGGCTNELLYYSECYAFVNFSTSCPATRF